MNNIILIAKTDETALVESNPIFIILLCRQRFQLKLPFITPNASHVQDFSSTV